MQAWMRQIYPFCRPLLDGVRDEGGGAAGYTTFLTDRGCGLEPPEDVCCIAGRADSVTLPPAPSGGVPGSFDDDCDERGDGVVASPTIASSLVAAATAASGEPR